MRPASALLLPLLLAACSSGNPVATDEQGLAFPSCLLANGDADPGELVDDTGAAKVQVAGAGCERSFTLTSTAARVDNLPADGRVVVEGAGPSLQTTNPLFDALFQLAFAEARENSVDAIRDWAFNDGKPLVCAPGGCFETGRKWNYVWTRDTSYSTDLGLGWVDPIRAMNSLELKLSGRRTDASATEIVQDTGTGGSYPVSSDRAVWALGARTLLQHLTGYARTRFRDAALVAAKNTAIRDRSVIFDAEDGLYRGEQSFLDWREQTYPRWTVPNTAHIAMSKSLSTNLAHLSLLELVAALSAEKGDAATEATMKGWASDLRSAIRKGFWLPEEGQLSTYRTTTLDPAPVRRFDLLGTSLAVLFGVTNAEESRAAIANYPTLPKGPPVVFPQQKETPVYHNRAIWPFVTSYWAKAARKVGNDAAFDVAIRSLVRGAALNLSNMENLEVETGRAHLDDGAYSGPVVNSQRQLWSVAGYVGAIVDGLFGVEAQDGGVKVAPFVPRQLHRALFPSARRIVLNDLELRGKHVTVVVRLPAATDGGGAYEIASLRFNGRPHDAFAKDAELGPRNLFEIELAGGARAAAVRTIPATGDYRRIFGPRTPIVALDRAAGKPRLQVDFSGESVGDVTWSVFRDGTRVARDLTGAQWEDPSSASGHCYAVDVTYRATGTTSQHSEPRCDWAAERVAAIPASAFDAKGGRLVEAYGRSFYEAWGDPDHELRATFTAKKSGEHLVQVTYGNGAGPIDTGVTCATKRVAIEDAATGKLAGEGFLVLPQRGDWGSWGDSTFVRVDLAAGRAYRVRLSHDERGVNMSAFSHFADYTGGLGGRAGAFYRANIAELKIFAR